MQRHALVHIGVGRLQQIDHAAVFPEDAIGEHRQLGAEVVAGIGAARRVRKHSRVRHDLVQPLHVEPLMHEVAGQCDRPRIGEHTLDLLIEHRGRAQLAGAGELQQLVVRE